MRFAFWAPQSKILPTLMPEVQEIFMFYHFLSNESKNNAVLKRSIVYFRGHVGFKAKTKDLSFKAKAKDFILCSRGQRRP